MHVIRRIATILKDSRFWLVIIAAALVVIAARGAMQGRGDRWSRIIDFAPRGGMSPNDIEDAIGPPDYRNADMWGYSPFAGHRMTNAGKPWPVTKYRLNIWFDNNRVRNFSREAAPNDPPF